MEAPPHIDDCIYTPEQIAYITKSVAQKAQEVLGDKLVKVILYGSYARGDYREWSDVDIMILADVDDMAAKIIDAKMFNELGDLSYNMNLLLSLIVVPNSRFEYFKEYYPFYMNVRKEGVRIYA